MITRDGLKVGAASLFGFGAPGMNLVVEVGEPLLKLLVLLGQSGVALMTILYIFAKWKQAKAKPRRVRRPRKSSHALEDIDDLKET